MKEKMLMPNDGTHLGRAVTETELTVALADTSTALNPEFLHRGFTIGLVGAPNSDLPENPRPISGLKHGFLVVNPLA